MAPTFTASSLPALESDQIKQLYLTHPDRHSAYSMILEAEQCTDRRLATVNVEDNHAYSSIQQAERRAVRLQSTDDRTAARVVGYLLLEFHALDNPFHDSLCATLARWITSLPQSAHDSQYDVVIKVGKLCRDKFIRLCAFDELSSYLDTYSCFQIWRSNAWYPPPPSYPSRPSFDTLTDMIKDIMECSDKDYKTTRKKVLARDGFQCMITKMIDECSLDHCIGLQLIQERDRIDTVTVETAHILSESTMQGTDPARNSEDQAHVNRTHYAASAMAILECFGLTELVEAFKEQGGIHEPWNLLSLEHDLHRKFDTLKLWFESTHQKDYYEVCFYKEITEDRVRRHLGLNSSAPIVVDLTARVEKVAPPHPYLLALHAACARVAHMSGAAEFFDRLRRDAEETMALAFDGSSALLLSNLMPPLAIVENMS